MPCTVLVTMQVAPQFQQEFFNQTTLHPVGVALTGLLALGMLFLPRRSAAVTLLLMACFMASGQRLALASLDFTLMRILILVGWTRLLARGELGISRWLLLDTFVLAMSVVELLAYTLLWGTPEALINRLGASLDYAGAYFLLRHLVRGWQDITVIATAACWVALPTAAFFLVEFSTGRNLFSVFSGVPEMTAIRAGRLRCQGAFSHPILAGCFWTSFIPLICSVGINNRARLPIVVFACLGALTVVFTCASSTPLLAVLVVAAVAACYPLRPWASMLSISGVAVLIALHLTMSRPVWHLLARMNALGSSTGWHRYHLIDEAVNHFGDWWLIGTKDTAYWGEGLHDITNEYILRGVHGGFLTMLLLVLTVWCALRYVGKACSAATTSPAETLGIWVLGASVMAHAVSFISTSYFGQITLAWVMSLALVAAAFSESTTKEEQLADIRLPVGDSR